MTIFLQVSTAAIRPHADLVNFKGSTFRSEVRNSSSSQYRETFKVGFACGGNYGEHAVVRVLQLALHDRVVEVVRIQHHPGLDFIVEGPPQFVLKTGCPAPDIPWGQYIAEPGSSYNNSEWCAHTNEPVFRLDTSLLHLADTITNHPNTTFIWAPYASYVAQYMLSAKLNQQLQHRTRADDRPYFLAWVASNCEHKERVFAFHEIQRRLATLNISGVHSLGSCNPNTNISIPPREDGFLPVVEVYRNYKYVLAFESAMEKGYVTEKIVTAFSAGAIPVYFGDSVGARLVLNGQAFVDVKEVWRSYTGGSIPSRPAADDWAAVADYLVALDNEHDLAYRLKEPLPIPALHAISLDYPNAPFPTNNISKRIIHDIRRQLIKQNGAVER